MEGAKPKLKEYAIISKDYHHLKLAHEEHVNRNAMLDARIKEYRLSLATTELTLSEMRSSVERKDAEVQRALQSKNTAADEIVELKKKVANLEAEISVASHSSSAEQDMEFSNHAADVQQLSLLQDECAQLRQTLESKQSMSKDFEANQDRLEDSKAFCSGLEGKVNTLNRALLERDAALEAKDEEIQELEYRMSIYVRQNDKERAENDEARSYLASANLKAKQTLQRTEMELRDSQIQLKTMEHKFRSQQQHTQQDSKSELVRSRGRISELEAQLLDAQSKMNQLKRRQSRSFSSPLSKVLTPSLAAKVASPLHQATKRTTCAPPWALHDSNSGQRNGPSYLTDAQRMEELRRRNEKNQRHLRTSYALETQDDKTSQFWNTLTQSAYVLSPAPLQSGQSDLGTTTAVAPKVDTLAGEIASLAGTCTMVTPATKKVQQPVVGTPPAAKDATNNSAQQNLRVRVSPRSASSVSPRKSSPLAFNNICVSSLLSKQIQDFQSPTDIGAMSPGTQLEHIYRTPSRFEHGQLMNKVGIPRMGAISETERSSSRLSERSSPGRSIAHYTIVLPFKIRCRQNLDLRCVFAIFIGSQHL